MLIKFGKPLSIIAAVLMTLLLAVSTAVPALAADTADTATDSNPQIVYDEPDLGEGSASDNCITLPDAPAKDGYIFKGWRVNGGSDLYSAGDVVAKDGSEELHLQAVYEATTATPEAAFAPDTASGDTSDTRQTVQTETVMGDYDTSMVYQWGPDDFLTLPKGEEKKDYLFRGYSVNGNTKLVQAGETVKIENGEKATVRPIYTSTRYKKLTNVLWTVGWICEGIGILLMWNFSFEKQNEWSLKAGIMLCGMSVFVAPLASCIIKSVFDARFLYAALAAIS